MPHTPRRDPIDAAIDKVQNPSTDRSTVRWAAWRLFDAGHFALAAPGFERLVEADPPDLTALAALVQIASNRTDVQHLTTLIENIVTERDPFLTRSDRFGLLQTLFDLTVPSDPALTRRFLEAVAESGSDAWRSVLEYDRRARIESSLRNDHTALPILEQLLYAPPDSGLPEEAVIRLEYLGCHRGTDRVLARDIERLLHLIGAVDAAYRVESCRRAALEAASEAKTAFEPADTHSSLAGVTVTIAGGHNALRSLVRRDLAESGIDDVREVPSAWEAVRDGRAVGATVAGSDLIVIIATQIAHSTSDQVKKAADRLGLPFVFAETATAHAIRQAIEHFVITKTR
jgi:hypothetical protein